MSGLGRNGDSRLRDITNQLSRARSKDYIHSHQPPPSESSLGGNRYGGASGIIEAGRQESQRLLMERYRRIDVEDSPSVNESASRRYRPQFNGLSAQPHNYYSGGSGSVPI